MGLRARARLSIPQKFLSAIEQLERIVG